MLEQHGEPVHVLRLPPTGPTGFDCRGFVVTSNINYKPLEAIASRLETIAFRLEAIATRFLMAIRLEAIASTLEAIHQTSIISRCSCRFARSHHQQQVEANLWADG